MSCPGDEDRPADERCWSAHSSSCFGLGTLVRYLLRSRRTLRLWRSGWIQLMKTSSGNPPLRQGAEGHGEVADPAGAQQLGRQEGAARPRCVEAQQPAGQAGRVVVEGLIRDEDEIGDTIRAAGADDELRAAAVVADQCDVAQVEFGEEPRDHGGERCEGEVGRRRASAWCAHRTGTPGRCSGSDPAGRRRRRPTGCRSSNPVQQHNDRPVAAGVGVHEAVGPSSCIRRPPRRGASCRQIVDAVWWGHGTALPGTGWRSIVLINASCCGRGSQSPISTLNR